MVTKTKNSRVFYGEKSLSELGRKFDEGGHDSLLLVTGRGFYEKCGAADLLAPFLQGKKVTRISDFETNPKKDDIIRILNETSSIEYTAILAVGGGSVMDVAKLIKCFKGTACQIDQFLYSETENVTPSPTALYMLPTTAGSGSEATHFAVLYDRGVKYSVAHPDLLPDAAWVLPSMLATVPPDIAASAALDAFCQGVESYWCINSTLESKRIARQAIELAWANMVPSVVDQSVFAHEAMGRASHLAGEAINVTKTTAPHAISYALTTHFDVLHGHAVALMLPEILKFNAAVTEVDLLDKRGVNYVKSTVNDICLMIGCDGPIEAAQAVNHKIKKMKLRANLRDLGVRTNDDCDVIVKNGFNPDRVNNNPRRLEEHQLRSILNSMLKNVDL